MALLQVHDAIVRDALGAWGGREVKHTGDGIMACFLSAVAAARCATQDPACVGSARAREQRLPVKVRIGAAAGEPVENHLDLFGSTVQLAARLCSHAQPEQSLVSNVVAELCIGKGLAFRTSEKFHSRASIARSECTLSNSPEKRRRIEAYLSRYL